MFKKPIAIASQHKLSGADSKKLIKLVRQFFPKASETDITKLLPSKDNIHLGKVASPSRVVIYLNENGVPIFIDLNGKGEIVPTVFSLWLVPSLLPAFVCKHDDVSHFVLAGADLMIPGVSFDEQAGSPRNYEKGELFAISVPNNPAPFAVGVTAMSSEAVVANKFKGKALIVYHFFGDALWALAPGSPVPNSGFSKDIIRGIQLADDNTEPAQEEAREDIETPVKTDELPKVEALSLNDESAEEDDKDADLPPAQDMDAIVEEALLNALCHIEDKSLPLTVSALWQQYIIPSRRAGTDLDIKATQWKKPGKLIQWAGKDGMLKAKDNKRDGLMLLTINRNHKKLKEFAPFSDNGSDKGSGKSSKEQEVKPKAEGLVVDTRYKSSTFTQLVFNKVGADPNQLLTRHEADEILKAYVEKFSLDQSKSDSGPSIYDPTPAEASALARATPQERDAMMTRNEGGKGKPKKQRSSMIQLDPILTDALFKGEKKKETGIPTEISKKDASMQFISRLQIWHSITHGEECIVRKGEPRPIHIVVESRMGRKRVTKVSGLEYFFIDPTLLAKEVQHRFAASTSIDPVPGAKKGEVEVLIQGYCAQELSKSLIDDHGVPKRFVFVKDKTAK